MGAEHKRLNADVFIKAIEGSDGVTSVICKRVGCSYETFQRRLKRHPTIRAAFDTECDKALGMCHSVLLTNIELAQKKQKETGLRVRTSDAKWYLSRKGKHQGFGKDVPSTEVNVGITVAGWKDQHRKRREAVEELEG